MMHHWKFANPTALRLSCASLALAAALSLAPDHALAQPVVPGTSAECPITTVAGELVAVCEGDLEDGVAASPGTPDFDRIEIRNANGPIEPNGVTAINLVKNNGDLEILIEDGVIINVLDNLANPLVTQAILAIAQNDFDVELTTGADITADGNGSFGIGIDAVAQDGGGVTITNTGDVDAFTSGDSARAISAFVESAAGGPISITSSGTLSAASGGTGEREFATSGILAVSQAADSTIDIDNTGDITVTSADGRFDTDFNGIAAGIVTNSFGSGTFTTINNSGNITATGPQVDGIVGFARVQSPTEGSLVRIVNDGTITATGTANRGIFAQTQGQLAEIGVINNAAINITADNSFGIFALHNDIFAPDINASEAMLSVRNEGEITIDGNNANGIFIQNNARSGTIILSNTADIDGSGPLTRGLGISSFFGVPDGDYEYLFENSGDITLDSEAARGITVFSSFDDEVDLTFVNEGNLDLSATTNALSSGIEINLNDSEFDTRGTGTESTSVANVTNTGDIAMGAGQAVIISADQITFENTGNLSTTGDTSDVVVVQGDVLNVILTDASLSSTGANSGAIVQERDANSGASTSTHILTRSAVSTSGDNSRGLSIDRTAQGSNIVNLTIDETDFDTLGGNSDAIFLGSLKTDSVLSVTVTGSDFATEGDGSRAFYSEDLGGTSASTLFFGQSTFSTLGDASSAIVVGDIPDDLNLVSRDRAIFALETFQTTISTAGNDSHGLAITPAGGPDSVSVIEVNESNFSTLGARSDAIRLTLPGSTIFQAPSGDLGGFRITDSTLTTQGDGSALVRVDSLDGSDVINVIVTNSTLSSTGDNSVAIVQQYGANAGGTSTNYELRESTVNTSGLNAHGLLIERQSEDANASALTLDLTDIATSGDNSDAIQVGSILSGSVISSNVTNGNFSTEGDNSRAVVFEALGGGSVALLNFSTSSFSTLGANSTAVLVADVPDGLVLDDRGSSVFSFFLNATVSTVGDNSKGVDVASYQGLASDTALGITESDITTRGANADAVSFGTLGMIGDGSFLTATVERSTISTDGDNSRGIDLASVTGDDSTSIIIIQDNTIQTGGSDSDAIALGTLSGLGVLNNSHGSSVEGNSVSTSGDDSRGVFVGLIRDGMSSGESLIGGEGRSDATFDLSGNTITTQGSRAHGIEFAEVTGDVTSGLLNVMISENMITTAGDDAVGIRLGDITGQVSGSDDFATDISLSISPASIITQGDGAHGLEIGSGWGALSTNDDANTTRQIALELSGTIEVSGLGSHGVVSNSLINDFQISETGSIISAQGFALKLDGSDEDFTILNAGTVDGDVIFGDGDDTFDTSGVFTGNIDLGGGANAIFVRAGGVFNSLDTVLLGEGNNIVIEGDLAPGGVMGSDGAGPFQTTMIGSNLFFEIGSRLLVDVDGMTMDDGFFVSDRIIVDGDILIEDSTLVVNSLTAEGDFDRSAQFLILVADGTLTGEFSSIEADLPFLDLSVTYEADRAILNAGRDGPVVPFASLGITPNQIAVAASFDALEENATGDLDDVIEQLIFANTDQALTAFDSASGEIYASLLAQGGQDGLRRSREALARSRSALSKGWGIWGGVAFSDGSIDGDGNAAAVDQNDFGFDFGIDYAGEGNQWAIGATTGWRNGELDVNARSSAADYDTFYLGGFARYGTGGKGVTISASVDYANIDASVTRGLTINALSRSATASVDIETYSVGLEGRYGFGAGGNWAIGPVATFLTADSELSLGNETGAGSVALQSADASDALSRFAGGLFANWQSETSAFDLSAQYVDGESDAVGARLAFADGASSPFTVFAPAVDGSGVLAAASARFSLGNGWSFGAQVDALVASEAEDVSASAVIGWRF